MNRVEELLRFTSVGLIATATHALTYLALLVATEPQTANLIGFSLAFVLSFLGHSRFTFTNNGVNARKSDLQFLRFLVVGLLGLSLNATFVHLSTGILSLPDWSAVVFVAGVTPTTVYVMLKLWVFRRKPQD